MPSAKPCLLLREWRNSRTTLLSSLRRSPELPFVLYLAGNFERRRSIAALKTYLDDIASNSIMDKRQLGNSDLQLSPIGFGAWAIGGGDWAFSWGPQDGSDSIAAIHKAIDLGVNWIDTAAVYGLGHSEEILCKAIKSASRK